MLAVGVERHVADAGVEEADLDGKGVEPSDVVAVPEAAAGTLRTVETGDGDAVWGNARPEHVTGEADGVERTAWGGSERVHHERRRSGEKRNIPCTAASWPERE